jgi:hypothetical protein
MPSSRSEHDHGAAYAQDAGAHTAESPVFLHFRLIIDDAAEPGVQCWFGARRWVLLEVLTSGTAFADPGLQTGRVAR